MEKLAVSPRRPPFNGDRVMSDRIRGQPSDHSLCSGKVQGFRQHTDLVRGRLLSSEVE